MTKDQKDSILVAGKMLAIVRDDPEKFSVAKKYFQSKINEVLSERISNLRAVN
jgi:hypothetical protein